MLQTAQIIPQQATLQVNNSYEKLYSTKSKPDSVLSNTNQLMRQKPQHTIIGTGAVNRRDNVRENWVFAVIESVHLPYV